MRTLLFLFLHWDHVDSYDSLHLVPNAPPQPPRPYRILSRSLRAANGSRSRWRRLLGVRIATVLFSSKKSRIGSASEERIIRFKSKPHAPGVLQPSVR